MISALLLPLLLSGVPAQPNAAAHDDPPIRLWISNDRRFVPGDRAKVQVRTEYDGYLIVVHIDPEGHLRMLFPLDPDKDNFVRSGKKYEVRGRGGREAFDVGANTGRGTVYAAVSRDPYHLDGFVLADHWDYRALAPSRLASDPEAELNDLVHRMAQSSFDYDLLAYDVLDRSSYAYGNTSSYYGSAYDDPGCYRFSCGRSYYGSPYGLSIGVVFGRPYRRYYYDPYYYAYDPFFNPFFYDPYYYAPAYYPRYVYPRQYYGYYDGYYGRNRSDRYRGYALPYTPYRFRGADGFTAGYRERTVIRRAVNTVYNPPITTQHEPPTATPARRVIEGPDAELPRGVAPRRSVGHATHSPPSERGREQPRAERARPEPRERAPAPEARPSRREAKQSSPPPSQDRGGARPEGRSSGGDRPEGRARPSDGGGRRRS